MRARVHTHSNKYTNLGFFRMIFKKKKANTEWLMDKSKRFSKKIWKNSNKFMRIYIHRWVDDTEKYLCIHSMNDHIWKCCVLWCKTIITCVRSHTPHSDNISRDYQSFEIHRKCILVLCVSSTSLSLPLHASDKNPFRLMTMPNAFIV